MIDIPPTTLVTVTYADRMRYLDVLLQRVFDAEGIAKAIVVSNASKSNLELLKQKWGARLRMIRLETNTGSANGYAAGIQAALGDSAAYIWLMDDDNAPIQGALSALHQRLAHNAAKLGADKVAVLGFRPEHQPDIAMGMDAKRAYPLHSSFLGFHYRQIFSKIWRRIKPMSIASPASLPEAVSIPYAPYGGLLASRELFERIGLPKREIVLYADDTEYTHRITALGGMIELVTRAKLEDLEKSWGLTDKFANAFLRWLRGGSDFRVYYASRNQAWFDKHVWATSIIEYKFNQIIFMGLLAYFAVCTSSYKRFYLLRRAIHNGQAATLGVDPEFPLT